MKEAGTSANFASLPDGSLLAGRYRIQEALGEGGHAAVYLAEDQRLNRRVALKVLDPLRGTDPVGRARFEREYQVLSRLSHPHIARCYSLERDGALDVLVMEYVEGETLAHRLLNGRLDQTEAVSIAIPLADALGACHEAGVLHRDLKPANIVLHPERGPVILDFGVAWFSSALNLTRTGAKIGTPRYMAPEVFINSLTDERADIYSLGVCLYEMVCGRSPYPAGSVAQLALGAGARQAPRASVVSPGISRGFSEVIARAIAPEAEDRYPTAGELCQALIRGQVLVTGTLRNTVPCDSCGTPRVITLGFCPGCGAPASWALEAGPNAVQLTAVADPERTLEWLQARYPRCLKRSAPVTLSRLHHLPVPLVVGVSARSAEQLLAEASDVGARAEIIRARAIIGARLDAANATPLEIGVSLGGHYALCVLLVYLMMLPDPGFGTSALFVPFLTPLVASALGLLAVRAYVRRPLLSVDIGDETSALGQVERFASIRERLGALEHPRSRRLAAAAVARALPALTDRGELMDVCTRQEILTALDDALEAVALVDTQATYLSARPRSRLAVELDAARRMAESGAPEAIDRLAELEVERSELLEASVAHDLGTRRALAACGRIMGVIRGMMEGARELDLITSPST